MAQAETNTNAWIIPNRKRQIVQVYDAAENDSDKTLTVPAGVIWDVHAILATLATSADAGNRQMTIVVGDGTNTLSTHNAAAVQTASGTEYYAFAPQYEAATETVATFHHIPLVPSLLPPGYTVRIYDSAAVAAAADDLTIRMVVTEYEAG